MDVSGLNIKIGADASGLDEAAKKVKQASDKISDSIGGAAKESSTAFEGMGESAKGVVEELLPIASAAEGIHLVAEFAGECVNAFAEAETAAVHLATAVKVIGGGNEVALQNLVDLAGELAAKYNDLYSKKELEGAEAQLETFGLTSKQIEKLLPQIIDFAQATGVDLKEATQMAEQAINGHGRALKQFGIVLGDTGSKTDNLAQLQDKLGKFSGVASAQMDTYANRMKEASNQTEELEEQLGEKLAPAFETVKEASLMAAKNVVDSISSMFESAQDRQSAFSESLKNASVKDLEGRKKTLSDSLSALQKYGEGESKVYLETLQNLNKVNYALADKIKLESTKTDTGEKDFKQKSDDSTKIKEAKDNIVTFSDIVKQAQNEMQNLGGTRVEMLDKEVEGAKESLKSLADQGITTGKVVDDLKSGIAKIGQEQSLKSLSIPVKSLRTEIDTFNGGPLLELHKKFSEIEETVKIFGKTPAIDELKEKLSATKEVMDEMIKKGKNINDVDFSKAKAEYDELNKKIKEGEEAQKKNIDVTGLLTNSISGVTQALASIGQQGANPLKGIIDTITAGMKSMGEQMIAIGIGKQLLVSLAAVPAPLLIAGGIALEFAATRAMGAIKMADGGIVHGSTLANVGEYAGANHNPEVVAPLSKLQGMMGHQGGGTLTTKISGSDIMLILNKESQNQGFASGGQGLQSYS